MTKLLLLIATMIVATTLQASEISGAESICGLQDDRVLSYDSRIGRLSKGDKHIGCTVTMISKTCGVTAGHCKPALEYAVFDVPLSSSTGVPQAAKLENKYYIDPKLTTVQDGKYSLGNDWGVVKFKKNDITGKFPGDVQGYYKIGLRIPQIGEKVVITGFGVDQDDKDKHGVQQTHYGVVTSKKAESSRFSYDADTMGGNSGSSILNHKNEIIGIHTNGGCTKYGGSNTGVMLRHNRSLRTAITKCLAR
jgi:V8-like Glu-specific endopeptidase